MYATERNQSNILFLSFFAFSVANLAIEMKNHSMLDGRVIKVLCGQIMNHMKEELEMQMSFSLCQGNSITSAYMS